MPRNDPADYAVFEKRIFELKTEISKSSHKSWQASIAHDKRGFVEARKKAAEVLLENCDVIAQYVGNFSPSVARSLAAQCMMVKEDYQEIRESNSADRVHSWCKRHLIPLVKSSEQAAHLVATLAEKKKSEAAGFHRWTRAG